MHGRSGSNTVELQKKLYYKLIKQIGIDSSERSQSGVGPDRIGYVWIDLKMYTLDAKRVQSRVVFPPEQTRNVLRSLTLEWARNPSASSLQFYQNKIDSYNLEKNVI